MTWLQFGALCIGVIGAAMLVTWIARTLLDRDDVGPFDGMGGL